VTFGLPEGLYQDSKLIEEIGIFKEVTLYKMYYFSWFDLLQKSKKDYDSIIILTYASTFSYNNKIANSSLSLIKKLNINRVPNWISNHLIINKKFEIFNNYVLEEPQSYFNNPKFLTSIVPVTYKIQYLWLLSHRKIEETTNYVNRDYFKLKEIDGIKNNPFISIEQDKIIFILENTYTQRT
jgi:hypothetical protein